MSPSGKIKKQWFLVDSGITRLEASVKGSFSSWLCLVYVEKLFRAVHLCLNWDSLPALTSVFLTFTSWKLPGLSVWQYIHVFFFSDNVYSPILSFLVGTLIEITWRQRENGSWNTQETHFKSLLKGKICAHRPEKVGALESMQRAHPAFEDFLVHMHRCLRSTSYVCDATMLRIGHIGPNDSRWICTLPECLSAHAWLWYQDVQATAQCGLNRNTCLWQLLERIIPLLTHPFPGTAHWAFFPEKIM